MGLRSSRAYRFTLLALSLALAGGGVYLVYRTYFRAPTVETIADRAAAEYAAGQQALDAGQFADAAARFDAAAGLARRAVAEAERRATADPGRRGDLDRLAGRAHWVAARAVRDRAFARAAADGKPLPATDDPVYGGQFRSFLAVPDPEERKEAVAALAAAARSAGDPDVLKEALRLEAMIHPPRWPLLEPYARAVAAADPADPRALYTLAQFEFEQPRPADGHSPTPDPKKARDRVAKAREYLARLGRDGKSPYWRTAHLEARILDWQAKHGGADPAAAAELRDLLFRPDAGAVARLARGEQFATLGTADVQGVVGLEQMAADAAAADARRPDGDPGQVLAVARAAAEAARKVLDEPTRGRAAPDLTAALLRLAAAFVPVAGAARPAEWQAFYDRVWAVAADPRAGADRPAVAAALGRFAVREWYVARHRGAAAALADRVGKIVPLLEAAAARAKGEPGAAADELHAALAELKYLRGDPADALEPHLAAARAAAAARPRALGRLIGAAAAARAGRLAAARQQADAAAGDPPDVAFRADVLLAYVCLAAGQHAAAIAPLRRVQDGYQKLAAFPVEEQAWVQDYFRGPQEVAALFAAAHLGAARQKYDRAKRDDPAGAAEAVAPHERAAAQGLKGLAAPTRADLLGRLAVAEFLAATDRGDEADKLLAALAADYPDSAEVLRARVERVVPPHRLVGYPPPAAPAPDLRRADEAIREFLAARPHARPARFFQAEWLARTDRLAEAVRHLDDPASFPGEEQKELGRLLAATTPGGGAGGLAEAFARVAPPRQLAAALIRAEAARPAGPGREVLDLPRHQAEGLARLADAARALADLKPGRAAIAFASAGEFASARPAVPAGLVLATRMYARADREKARELAVRLAVEAPAEPGVYLAAALAAHATGDLGGPNDSWDRTKSVSAALARWEAVTRTAQPELDAALVRKELWQAAQSPR